VTAFAYGHETVASDRQIEQQGAGRERLDLRGFVG